MTPAQKTAAAYQYFTLEEWKLLARALGYLYGETEGTPAAIPKEEFLNLLTKLPSAAL